jgi:hypothetical protein
MTSTCNPIFFYDNPTPGLSQILDKLLPYMYTDKQSSPTIPVHQINNITEAPPAAEPSKQDVITPNHPDSLFWCIYILAHGYRDYIQIARNYGVKKLEVNKSVMQYMQQNMTKFHETNIKMTKLSAQTTMSELLSIQPTTNLNCLLAMCIYYKLNVYLVDANKKGMLKMISNSENDNPTYFIYKGENGIYSVDIEPISQERLSSIDNELVCLDSSARPLKTISHYKVEELVTLAERLKIYDVNTKYKKADLYKEISETLMWR